MYELGVRQVEKQSKYETRNFRKAKKLSKLKAIQATAFLRK